MKTIVLIVPYLYILSVNSENSTHSEDLDRKDEENKAVLWNNLFVKIDALLSETEKLSQNISDIHKRLDDLDERQNSQDVRLTTYLEKFEEIHEDNKMQLKTHEDHFTKIIENIEEIQADVKKVYKTQIYTSNQWTTILRRQDSSLPFFRTWNEYRDGFGEPNGNYFVGLQWLHNMTTFGPPQELFIILRSYKNQMRYARYDLFRIGNETEKYALLELGQYNGNAGDGLTDHLGHKFSTYDQDNDDNDEKNCADAYMSGWWFFGNCIASNLNGRLGEFSGDWGISWQTWTDGTSLKYAEMLIRPKLV